MTDDRPAHNLMADLRASLAEAREALRVPADDDVILVALSRDDYRFIAEYDPDRERSASRADMVDVLGTISGLVSEGRERARERDR
jgi:hypothetical protein